MNTLALKRTRLEIHLDNLLENLATIKNHIANEKVEIMAVVKADAYGHGDLTIVKTLHENGVNFFGVASFDEALNIRTALPKEGADILTLGYNPPETAKILFENNITQTVFNLAYATKLEAEATKFDKKIPCHLKIDTGMGRLGLATFDINETIAEAEAILNMPHLNFTGIFTHFSHSDTYTGEDYTKKQFDSFTHIIKILEDKGYNLGIKHCCNSGATLSYPQMYMDMVRVGTLLYGASGSPEKKNILPLKTVMSLKGVISSLKWVEPSSFIGYDRTFKTTRNTLIATVPIGYADGYNRNIGRYGNASVHGVRVPILGLICMDQTMMDVTDVKGVAEGDDVCLMGYTPDNSGVSLDEISGWISQTKYEIFCSISKRVFRIYIKDGKPVSSETYKNVVY